MVFTVAGTPAVTHEVYDTILGFMSTADIAVQTFTEELRPPLF